ncbi:hypothetical protein PAXRUDRAFT_145649 [Paxillus rubicundulus Ve08.2h10]|uniref:Tc1-like transposase DDE domain-containing protein n=1 Tax=Paxillus rubicundulus Ve08.2h10 TaxID=930991 RepID=A0A0D0DV17_9AGAM|nr:hypothetical protein PAXRUDRAFT_145649 [Paxillus rubicundulus Ve08.2h10]
MDNCAIHHDDEVCEIIEVQCGKSSSLLSVVAHPQRFYAGAKLIYLPPYSPDFNLIGQAFSSIKAWLWCHEREALTSQVRSWLIHQAVMSVSPEDVESWIINCRYL